jgi:hypothetical protein
MVLNGIQILGLVVLELIILDLTVKTAADSAHLLSSTSDHSRLIQSLVYLGSNVVLGLVILGYF